MVRTSRASPPGSAIESRATTTACARREPPPKKESILRLHRVAVPSPPNGTAADILIACAVACARVKVDKPPSAAQLFKSERAERRGCQKAHAGGPCNYTYDLLILPVHYRDRHLFLSLGAARLWCGAVVRCGFGCGSLNTNAHICGYNSLFMRARAQTRFAERSLGVVLQSRLCGARRCRASSRGAAL